MKRFMLVVAILLLAVPSLFALAQDEAPSEITFMMPAGYGTEGIEYDSAGEQYLVGTLFGGVIYAVKDDGSVEPFIEDEEFMSVSGIHIDAATNRLLVSNTDAAPMFGGDPSEIQTTLIAYDLETREKLFNVDLTSLGDSPVHFGNDVAVDADGNAYVTDSLAPNIYKVDPEGNASLFISDERLGNEIFGLNGIEVHPNGYLLAGVSGSGEIYKIPLDDPSAMTLVAIPAGVGVDGMVFTPDWQIATIAMLYDGTSAEPPQSLVLLSSDDDWATAEIVGSVETTGAATTVAIRDGSADYINAYLGDMTREEYQIVRVPLTDLGASAE